jgi:hypothetical protein
VLSKLLIIRFLVAIFNNKFRKLFENQDYMNRLTIINLKNSRSYDKLKGAITTSFFPINIILVPFIIPIVYLDSERLNETVLKSQYTILLLLYTALATVTSFLFMPLIYLKSLVNSIYIIFATKRELYKGEKIFLFLMNLLFGPIVIIVSMTIDIGSLTEFLLRSE